MNMQYRELMMYPHGAEVYLVDRQTKDEAYKVLSPTPTHPLFVSDARWTRSTNKVDYLVNGVWYEDPMVFDARDSAQLFANRLNAVKGR